MRAFATYAVLVLAIPLWAQSRPESGAAGQDGIEALEPLMARARAGAPDPDTVSAIVEGLLRTEHAIAAPWWLDLAVGGDAKLTASERERIAKLRRACERPETFADVRKLLLRLVRHAELLAVDKDFEGARQAAAAARGMLGLVPDAGLMRMLDAADKRIPARRPEEAAASRDRSAWPAAFESELAAAARRLAEAGAAAYRAAGCGPGRDTLARSIRAMAGILPPPDLAAALDRVRDLTPTVEPDSGLTIFLRTVGTARAFREGIPYFVDQGQRAFDAEKHDPIVIPVLPGDLVTIAIDEPYTADDFGGRSYVIALHARFEGRDLGTKDLFCDLAKEPGAIGAGLLPVPIAKKKSDPPKSLFGRNREQDEALRTYNAYFDLPQTTQRSVDVPCLADMIGFAQEFDTRKLGFHWIGTETERFAVVIKVPEG